MPEFLMAALLPRVSARRFRRFGIFVYLCSIPALTFAQVPNTFENGNVADADAVNANFQNLDNRVQTLEAEGAVTSVLPEGAFELRFGSLISRQLRSISLQVPVPGTDTINFGSAVFAVDGIPISLEVTSRSRTVTANAIDTPLHTLCDPEVHVAFLPVELSSIYSSGRDILALASQTVEESSDASNTEASILCLRPYGEGLFESTVFSNLRLVNGQGRFACAQIASGGQFSYVINAEDGLPRADLFGTDVSFVEDGVLYAGSVIGEFIDPVLSERVVQVPATCPP